MRFKLLDQHFQISRDFPAGDYVFTMSGENAESDQVGFEIELTGTKYGPEDFEVRLKSLQADGAAGFRIYIDGRDRFARYWTFDSAPPNPNRSADPDVTPEITVTPTPTPTPVPTLRHGISYPANTRYPSRSAIWSYYRAR